jgi:hypothetical protein
VLPDLNFLLAIPSKGTLHVGIRRAVAQQQSAGSVHMIEIIQAIFYWILHAMLWGSELIAAALLLAWLYYVIVLEPRIRRKKQQAAGSKSAEQSADGRHSDN